MHTTGCGLFADLCPDGTGPVGVQPALFQLHGSTQATLPRSRTLQRAGRAPAQRGTESCVHATALITQNASRFRAETARSAPVLDPRMPGGWMDVRVTESKSAYSRIQRRKWLGGLEDVREALPRKRQDRHVFPRRN